MIKIKAKIELYREFRKTSFISGYRPLFNFIAEMKISGHITLLDRNEFFPGEKGIVEISLMTEGYFGNELRPNGKFTFGEGKYNIGEGEEIEIIS